MRSRARALILAVLLCVPVAAFGQAGAPARRITAGATLPATCISSVVIRDIFYKSGSNAGLYVCTAANTWTLQSGSADVVGPASATDNAIVRFNGTTGKLLQDSLVTISDLGAMDLPAGVQLTWGGVAEGLTYISGTGPRFEDASAGVLWTLNLQSLSGNRTVTVPDTGGTMALTSSNVATATALAADPAGCTNQFVRDVAANGTLTCASVAVADLDAGAVSGTGTVVLTTMPVLGDTLFGALGTPANGAITYCSDCTKATPCTGSGTGAIAKRLNGAWDCD